MDVEKNKGVFISHNFRDKETAREIALFLIAEDINVWFDEWQISAGDSIVEQINNGLRGCSHFIILWSESADKSNWVRRELQSTIAKAIRTGIPKIIPVILDDNSLPELLADILYISYEDGSESDRSKIIDAVTGHQPTNNFIKAIAKKYNEVVFDPDSNDPLPFKACPSCGSTSLKLKCYNYRDDDYFIIDCVECGWGTWTQ